MGSHFSFPPYKPYNLEHAVEPIFSLRFITIETGTTFSSGVGWEMTLYPYFAQCLAQTGCCMHVYFTSLLNFHRTLSESVLGLGWLSI